MPSSRSPLADFTRPCGPPSTTLPAAGACEGSTRGASEKTKAAIAHHEATCRPCSIRGAIGLSINSRSVGAIARITRGTVGIPAALFPDVADEVVEIIVAQGVLVGRHGRPAVPDFFLHGGIVHRLA